MNNVTGAYESIRGKIVSEWRAANGYVYLNATVPVNTTATIYVPTSEAASVVESGVPDEVLTTPRHPYTQALLDAVPRGLERRDRKRTVLPVEAGETAGGCRFRRRCIHAMTECAVNDPALETAGPGHQAACLLVKHA